jgi:hypothetical protein
MTQFRPYRFPSPNLGSDFQASVNRWMVRNALRYLLARYKDQLPLPSHPALTDWILDLLDRLGSARVVSLYDTQGHQARGTITTDDAERMAADAATFAMYRFDPEAYLDRAATGGRHSKRGPSFTLTDLHRVGGMSISQAAAELGCSPATISRLRARAKAQANVIPIITGDPIMDALLASTSTNNVIQFRRSA